MSGNTQAAAPRVGPLTGGAREEALETARGAYVELLGAERRVRGRDRQRAGQLTHAQLGAILILGARQRVTAGQLAQAAELNPASITAMLDTLEESGIVTRARDETDRRVCLVQLTPHGRSLVSEQEARLKAMWRESLADVDDESLYAAADVIRRIVRMLDEL